MRWRRRKYRFKSKRRRWPIWVAAVLCTFFLLTWLPVFALRWLAPPITTFMLLDPDARADLDYEWTDWTSISSSVPLAVIASEDQKFPSHFGFDLESIRDAIDDSQNGGPLRGASTISQQVAKNLFLWNGRSFVRKGIEAYFTVLIEATWPKQRILEVYVNIAEFGPGVFGVGAASRRFFADSPSRIGDAQAALLAAVLPNPKRLQADQPSVYVRERQSWILGQMRRLRRERVLASLG
jgi:monofunctional biosynthetic peptidoglycan transglycosylase